MRIFSKNLMNSDFSLRSEVYWRRSVWSHRRTCLILRHAIYTVCYIPVLLFGTFYYQWEFKILWNFELPAEVSRSKIAENSAFWYRKYFISSKLMESTLVYELIRPSTFKKCCLTNSSTMKYKVDDQRSKWTVPENKIRRSVWVKIVVKYRSKRWRTKLDVSKWLVWEIVRP